MNSMTKPLAILRLVAVRLAFCIGMLARRMPRKAGTNPPSRHCDHMTFSQHTRAVYGLPITRRIE